MLLIIVLMLAQRNALFPLMFCVGWLKVTQLPLVFYSPFQIFSIKKLEIFCVLR